MNRSTEAASGADVNSGAYRSNRHRWLPLRATRAVIGGDHGMWLKHQGKLLQLLDGVLKGQPNLDLGLVGEKSVVNSIQSVALCLRPAFAFSFLSDKHCVSLLSLHVSVSSSVQ